MNIVINKYILIFLCMISTNILIAQDIEVIAHEVYIDSTIGSEMVFDFEIINISLFHQTVFEVRTVNDLPQDWISSLCFGVNCFSPFLDSAATTPEFFTDPLSPGDTLETSLHVTAINNDGTANVQIQIGTFRNPTVRNTIDFVATTTQVSTGNDKQLVSNYYLDQNFPNPFNPITKINFGMRKAGDVEITLYNILGSKIATIFSGYKDAGNHSVYLHAANLSSGVYFYTLRTNEFIQTKKMILEK